jgi:hypothetical protein
VYECYAPDERRKIDKSAMHGSVDLMDLHMQGPGDSVVPSKVDLMDLMKGAGDSAVDLMNLMKGAGGGLDPDVDSVMTFPSKPSLEAGAGHSSAFQLNLSRFCH